MNISKRLLALIALLPGLAVAPRPFAQTLLTDKFHTPPSSATSGVGNWLYYKGACLTAGIGAGTVAPAPASTIPACTDVADFVLQLGAGRGPVTWWVVPMAFWVVTRRRRPQRRRYRTLPPTAVPPHPCCGALRFTNGKSLRQPGAWGHRLNQTPIHHRPASR